VFFALVAILAVAAVWFAVSKVRGRPLAGEGTGKVLVALIIAAVAFWLFGGGALLEP